MIFENLPHTESQKLSDEYANKFFKLKSIPEKSNDWRVIFSKSSGDYSYQVVVQNVPVISNNHYHIFLYVKGEATGYVYHSCGPKLPPVWDKLDKLDYYDYVEIQKMINEKLFVANEITPPELDDDRVGRYVYFLAEPPDQAYLKAATGQSYKIVAVKAETEAFMKQKPGFLDFTFFEFT